MFFGSKKAKAQDPAPELVNVSASIAATAQTAQSAPPPESAMATVTATASTKPVPPNSTTPPTLSPEQARARADFSRRVSAAFGEIVSVLMRSKTYRQLTLAGLEHLVVPAVVNGQFALAEAHSKENGFTAPVGVLLWASVSEEIDKRLTAATDQPPKLAPNEWKSGDIVWLVEAVGERAIVQALVQQQVEKTWEGKVAKMRARTAEGASIVKVLTNP